MKNLQKGFTLVELLTVLMIVAILTAVGLPQYGKAVERSRVSEAQAMLRTIYDSSERLAGEFGYRSYEQLRTVKGTANEANFSFPRLDMFDADNLPAGCCLGERNENGTCGAGDNTLLTCQRFAYKIAVSGTTDTSKSYVAAKKRSDKNQGVYILLDRNSLQVSCQPISSSVQDTEVCDVYGLDINHAGVSF